MSERFEHEVARRRRISVTGPVTLNMERALRKTYDATPERASLWQLARVVAAAESSAGTTLPAAVSTPSSRRRLYPRLPANPPRACWTESSRP